MLCFKTFLNTAFVNVDHFFSVVVLKIFLDDLVSAIKWKAIKQMQVIMSNYVITSLQQVLLMKVM